MLGNSYTWGNINIYYYSYIRQFNEKYTTNHVYFMVPLLLVFQNSFPLLSGFLDKIIGTRLLVLIGSLLIIGCHVLLYLFTSFFYTVIAMCMYGAGNGLIYFSIMGCCWSYFPNKKGLISGVIVCFYGGSSFLFTLLAEYIINPNNLPKVKDHDYFDREIAMRVKIFVKVLIIIFTCMGTLAVILVFPHEKEKSEEEEEILQKLDERESQPLGQAVKSSQFITFLIFTGCVMFYGYIVTNTSRGFGTVSELNQRMLKYLSVAYAILNASARLCWGHIFDKYGYFYPYLFVCINQILSSSALYFSGMNNYSYFVVTLLSVLSFSGHATMFPPFVGKTFGIKNSVILIGIIGFANTVVSILGPVFCFFIIKNKKDYLTVFLIGTAFTLIGFILLFFLNDTPFNYKTQEDKDYNEESGLCKKEDASETL